MILTRFCFFLFLLILYYLLLVVFSAAAPTWRPRSVTVRAGDEVTFPCRQPVDAVKNCDDVTWLFRGGSQLQLVQLEIGKSDRLSLAADCSLLLKKVRAEDVGGYVCRHSGGTLDIPVYLSLISSEYLHLNVFVPIS